MTLGVGKFFGDIFNFLGSASVLGIDVGTSSIKIAELARKGARSAFVNYGILETRDYLDQANRALQTSSLGIVENEIAPLLKLVLGETKVKATRALFSIPAFASFVTLLDMPLLSEKETSQSINFQAKRYIPMPIEQVSVDWVKVDEYTSGKGQKYQRLLLIGVPHRIITSYKNLAKAAGLRAIAFEIESIALARALPPFDAPTLVVDVGAESTNMVVTEGGLVKHTAQTDYSAVHITRALSKSLSLGMPRAEVLKRRRGLLGQAGDSELSTLILPFLDVIIQEVSYAKGVYERRYGKKVKQFTLVGGGAHLIGVAKHFSLQLGLPYAAPEPFGEVDYRPDLEPAMKYLKREFPVAVGLAKRYFAT